MSSSFGPPPPKTRYGDQDFIKEDFTPPQDRPMSPTLVPRQTSGGHGPDANYSAQVPTGVKTPYGQPLPPVSGVGPPGSFDVSNLTEQVRSLTPEDQIFMRSWRQDSFYYRVLPLSILGSGALFYYYKSKNLPHKTSRYLLVSMASYFIGKWSYKDELKRRLEKTPLNTPFIQKLRELVGVRSLMSVGEFSSDTNPEFYGGSYNSDQSYLSWGSTDPMARDTSSQKRPYMGPGSVGPVERSAGYGRPDVTNQPYETDSSGFGTRSSGEPKTQSSYEELRARNRGLIQK